MGVLLHWADLINKDFDKATKEDIMQAVRVIQEDKKYTPWTKATYKIMLKRFYKWLKNSKTMPEEVGWIYSIVKRSEVTLPSNGDLLTEEDIKKIIKVANNPRDKALVATLYEGGFRIGELASMQLKNVTFDTHGVILHVQGKTGSRMTRIVTATPYLSTWLQNHPDADDPNAPVWVNTGSKNHGQMMEYRAIWALLRTLLQKAGIRKRANPHIFRHSRATFLANHLTEFQMNQYFGWIQGSSMPATYVHMSGKSLDASILALNGIQTPQEAKTAKFSPITCPRCDTLNTNEARFCIKCAAILDIKAAFEIEEKAKLEQEMRSQSDNIMNKLMQDKEFAVMLAKKLKELGGAGIPS